jgi:hypothetical protein
MDNPISIRWKKLFQKNCSHWTDAQKRQYLNIVNDPDEVDEIEIESSIELIEKINGKKAVE